MTANPASTITKHAINSVPIIKRHRLFQYQKSGKHLST